MSVRYQGTSGSHQLTVSIAGTQVHTLCIWARAAVTTTTDATLIHLDNGTDTDSSRIGYVDVSGTHSSVFVQHRTGIGSTAVLPATSGSAWHHLALVIDGTNQVSYVDGAQVDSRAFDPSLRTTGFTVLRIGPNNGGATNPDNTVQDAMVFKAALSATDILNVMRGTVPDSVSANLYGWWPLYGDTPLADFSGNGRTLSTTGGTPATGTLFAPNVWAHANRSQLVPVQYVSTLTAISATGTVTSGGSGSLQNLVSGAGGVVSAASGTLTVAVALSAAGGVVSAGSATRSVTQTIAATGGTTSAGSGTLTGSAALSGTGGNQSAASGTLAAAVALSGAGGVVSAGSAAYTVAASLTATGAAVSAGTATAAAAVALSGAGGVTSAGAATRSLKQDISAAGGVTSAGSASFSATIALTGAGAVTSAGSATLSGGGGITATGSVVSAGAGTLAVAAAKSAAGGITSAGTGTLSATYALSGAGGATSGGLGTLTSRVALSGAGGIISAGSVFLPLAISATGAIRSGASGTLTSSNVLETPWSGWSDGGDITAATPHGVWLEDASGTSSTAAAHGSWAADVDGSSGAAHGVWIEDPVPGGVVLHPELVFPLVAVGASRSGGGATLTRSTLQPTLYGTALTGAEYSIAKNWVFGTNGNVTNAAALNAEFTYHDPFGTISNGSNYGALMQRAAGAPTFGVYNWADVGMANDQQPEDTTGRYRTFQSDSLLCHVKPLNTGSVVVGPASTHNAGCGSFASQLTYSAGGARLGQTIIWETRVRVVSAPNGYWFALWLVGPQWDGGPEIDLVEAFSSTAPNVNADLFNSNGIGGTNSKDYFGGPWENVVSTLGIPGYAIPNGSQSLRNWHTFTLEYAADNSFRCFLDSTLIQSGTLDWKLPSSPTVPTLSFLFDFGFGHTGISPINAAVISDITATPLTYEIAYSRIWTR